MCVPSMIIPSTCHACITHHAAGGVVYHFGERLVRSIAQLPATKKMQNTATAAVFVVFISNRSFYPVTEHEIKGVHVGSCS